MKRQQILVAWVVSHLALSVGACGSEATEPEFPLTIGKSCTAEELATTTRLVNGRWEVRYGVNDVSKRIVTRPDGVLVEQTVLSCRLEICSIPQGTIVSTAAQAIAWCKQLNNG